MRRAKNLRTSFQVWLGMMGLMIALVAGLFLSQFTIIGHADTTGKITASSAKIRKDPSTSGTTLGSIPKDTSVTIIGKTQGSDGYTWYQVYADANNKGYIRSDLVSVSDSSAIPDVGAGSTDSSSEEGVTKVNPVSATISGGETVRIRGKASTGSAIITTASNGLAVTVLGTANGTDGKVWYQITYNANGKDVTGFVRSDYATLSGELTPLGTGSDVTTPSQDTGNDTTTTPPAEETKPEKKDFETEKGSDGVWYLIDWTKENGEKHDIQELFSLVTNNEAAYRELQGTWKVGKIVIGLLVVLFIAACGAAIYLAMLLKDAKDSAYIQKVENETLRRRGADKARQGEKTHVTEQKKGEAPKVIQTSGDRPAPNKPAEVRPKEGARPVRPEGARPVRPEGARPEGARPVRPEGARPEGARPVRPEGARPEGARPVRPEGVRPEGARPVRPEGARPEGARPVRPEGVRPEGARPARPEETKASRPVRNFTSDGDDFEFDFLNEDE